MANLVVDIHKAIPHKASLLVDLVRSFKSKVTLTDGAYSADAHSYLELLLLWSTTKQDAFQVLIQGEDEDWVAAKISELFNNGGGI